MQLTGLISSSDDIAEFRIAKRLATFYVETRNADQAGIVDAFLNRCTFDIREDVAVCILDTGVNNGHPLLRPALQDKDRHAVDALWPSTDDQNVPHGTLMAGTVLYGNLLDHLSADHRLLIRHQLESVRILPPSPDYNDPRFWAYITLQAASIAEINEPERKRVFCLAVTSDETRDRGHPTAWSAALDKLASGQDDGHRRLILVSGGNAFGSSVWTNYPESNLVEEIQDPGQSWNAVTVGAFTELTRIDDPDLAGYSPLAPYRTLSPFSTTSTTWPHNKWPIKPDVMFEGGNVAAGPNRSTIDHEDLKLITTASDPQIANFVGFGETSAATALAAEMAARIQVEYPAAWPETVRGLIIHSAEWTSQMKLQFDGANDLSKHAVGRLLRIFGYGVPDLNRALYCASNPLTLITEAEIQPFDKDGRSLTTRDMHLYDLPWPSEILRNLADQTVRMRITLSYFVEPGPERVGWNDRYRYPSHGLRFDINSPTETEQEFVHRVNWQAREEDESADTTGPLDHWTIGPINRKMGSVHSDIWTGTAAQLAESNHIAIFPTTGWWRTRHHLGSWDKKTRYSLVVSIETPEVDNDIYVAVATKIGIAIPVTIPTGQ